MQSDPVTMERDAIVAHMRCAIARGYSQKAAGQCEHGKFYFEDCIGCYDEYLDGELSAILNGAHLTKDSDNAE